ncbi:MAG: DUF459 domain-containing protein [Hoeflea sp.]|uniref:SGNH/GDSL hydrolase family protein n=1 Tax=Hoeflea sp. TaxID=1940281 RepID=UPI002731A54E|nr:DUF459 domain-containing protein [Hoeflea sp.]MDP2122331.1 DUF459 domain-containing protein [Hoeflea sp.]MDP3526692.1 DUF459 domain-containing protein [Hoeflea sp.]
MAGLAVLQAVQPAAAQERVERKSFIQLLFGGGRSAPKEPKPSAEAPRTSRVKKPVRSEVAAPPPEPAVEKLEDARKILVIGDFLANGAADGLSEAFAKSPGVVVVDRTNGSSGLVRADYYDWIGEAPAIIQEVRPSIIVVQIGSNDRQQLMVNGEREAVRSVNWLAEYERRTQRLISILRTGNAPLLWVGLPAFKSPAMTTDIVVLNGVQRKLVELAGGEFIDIWDGFVDEEGKFIFTGSDINGQQVRLRGSDGINLTKAGKRKIAFYVEKSARRLLGDAAAIGATAFSSDDFPEILMPPAPGENATAITRTIPVAMTDPDLDGGTALLGDMPASASLIRSPRDILVTDGMLPEPPTGRVDNYAWPRGNR